MDDPKEIVRQGYDQLRDAYRIYYEQGNSSRYHAWLTELTMRLPAGGNVLELGCADGIPTAQFLSEQFNYRGVDISPVQVALAQRNVPAAVFIVADMALLAFPDASFDGVIALYSIIHLPLREQPILFESIYRWLKPGGYFLCVVGTVEWTGKSSDWILPNVEMYWSHTDKHTYQSWFIKIGFSVLENYFVPEGDGGHTFFLLKKPH